MRFDGWQPPEIEHGKPTKWNWIVYHPQNLKLGVKVDIGAFSYINAEVGVELGDEVQLGSHCSIYSVSTIDNKRAAVILKKNARVGSHSTVLPGVTIGENSIVGAHSLVNKDIPDNVVAYGVPAKVVKNLEANSSDAKKNVLGWKIPLFKTYSTTEDIEAVTKVIKRGTRWACGPEIEEFEQKISEYVGTEYALTFNSGTSALHTLLLAHGIGQGDEVIIPSFTFIATANAVVLAGGTPVFAESESDTFGLDIEDVEKKITAKTKAIITIHYGGFPAKDIKKLRTLADNKNILLIEDAAESIGAKIEEQEVGSFGHSAIFSFCQGKVLAVGEGGALVTNSKEVYEKSKLIRSHGRVEESEDYFSSIGDNDYIQVGYNYRMPTLLGALGISQLNKIQEIIGMRRKGAQHLNESLSQISEIKIPTQLPGHYPVYQMYSIQLENKEIRDNLQKHLEKNGIMSKVYFHPVHLKTIYKQKYGCKEGDLPKTELLSDKVLNIPLYPTITKEELNYLIEKIKEYFKLKQINKNYGSNQNEY